MRRRLVTICVCLLLGAIVNVAVAWGLSLWGKLPWSAQIEFLEQTPPDLEEFVPPNWVDSNTHVVMRPLKRSSIAGLKIIQLTSISVSIGPGQITRPVPRVLHLQRAGWPLLALECTGHLEWKDSPSNGDQILVPRWHAGFNVGSAFSPRTEDLYCPTYERPLPLQPLWPGFAINTVFYAAIVWLLFAVPGRIRRFIRIRRGRCGACGYPIGTSDVCTECGKPVPKRLGSCGSSRPDHLPGGERIQSGFQTFM
jgi:hypothetical protein